MFPTPSPRPAFFFFAGYRFSATAGATTTNTFSSIPLQYFTSAGRVEGTVCRILRYHSDHSNSFALLFLIAASIRVTSENGGIVPTPQPPQPPACLCQLRILLRKAEPQQVFTTAGRKER